MKAKRISELPIYSGDTSGSWLIINSPNQLETFKIRKEDLLNVNLKLVLESGNETDGNNIVLSDNDTIEAKNGNGQLNLRAYGVNNSVLLSTDKGNWSGSHVYLDDNYASFESISEGGRLDLYADDYNVGLNMGGYHNADFSVYGSNGFSIDNNIDDNISSNMNCQINHNDNITLFSDSIAMGKNLLNVNSLIGLKKPNKYINIGIGNNTCTEVDINNNEPNEIGKYVIKQINRNPKFYIIFTDNGNIKFEVNEDLNEEEILNLLK